MQTLNIVLLTIGIIMLIESFLLILFPNFLIKLSKKISNKKTIFKIAFLELIGSLVLIGISLIL